MKPHSSSAQLALVPAGLDDVEQLARMNLALLADEQYDRNFTLPELIDRMRGFLEGPYAAWLIACDGATIGYCLVLTDRSPCYLRHFYIMPERRRRGFGRRAIELLLRELDVRSLDVEVMIWNEPARAFWRALGFRPRYEGLRFGADRS